MRPLAGVRLRVCGFSARLLRGHRQTTSSCTSRFESQASIEAGRVTVDGKAVKSGHVLRDGQRIVLISAEEPW